MFEQWAAPNMALACYALVATCGWLQSYGSVAQTLLLAGVHSAGVVALWAIALQSFLNHGVLPTVAQLLGCVPMPSSLSQVLWRICRLAVLGLCSAGAWLYTTTALELLAAQGLLVAVTAGLMLLTTRGLACLHYAAWARWAARHFDRCVMHGQESWDSGGANYCLASQRRALQHLERVDPLVPRSLFALPRLPVVVRVMLALATAPFSLGAVGRLVAHRLLRSPLAILRPGYVGLTPVMVAVIKERSGLVAECLAVGADIYCVDEWGMSALDYAVQLKAAGRGECLNAIASGVCGGPTDLPQEAVLLAEVKPVLINATLQILPCIGNADVVRRHFTKSTEFLFNFQLVPAHALENLPFKSATPFDGTEAVSPHIVFISTDGENTSLAISREATAAAVVQLVARHNLDAKNVHLWLDREAPSTDLKCASSLLLRLASSHFYINIISAPAPRRFLAVLFFSPSDFITFAMQLQLDRIFFRNSAALDFSKFLRAAQGLLCFEFIGNQLKCCDETETRAADGACAASSASDNLCDVSSSGSDSAVRKFHRWQAQFLHAKLASRYRNSQLRMDPQMAAAASVPTTVDASLEQVVSGL